MIKPPKKNKLNAFTLTELLVVMVIIGILVLLAWPKLTTYVTKARSLEAQVHLKHIHGLEKVYHLNHFKYSNDLEELGYEPEKVRTEEGEGDAFYQITIEEATASSFIAKATAVVDFDGDGQFNVWQINQDKELKEIVKD